MGALEQLIVTLREGVEAALIVAIALAYLAKIGRSDLNRVVYAALAAAVGVSVAGAIVLSAVGGNTDRYEGWLMLIAAVFVFTMVWWMHRTARFLKRDIETRLSRLQNGGAVGLFLFIFFMVLREGVETVLMLTAITLDTAALWAWLGGIVGLLLAAGFAVAFVRGSLRIHLPRFFRITTAILLVIGAQLLLSGVHELMEAGVLPSSAREMAIVGPIVANEAFFFIVILGLAGILLWRERGSGRADEAAASASPAAQRKQLAAARAERRWSALGTAAAFAFLVLIGGSYAYARAEGSLTPAEPVAAVAGWVKLPLQQVDDGQLHRFQVQTDAGAVRFFAMRRPDGTIAVALDACQICGAMGYIQRGSQLYCRHCGAPINPASLGTAGGCNPIPLAAQMRDGMVMVALGELAPEASRFQSH
ncbi:MAG: Fe-S-containing protein [Terriglobales bacterium]